MSWQEKDRVHLRKEFVVLADKAEADMSALCRHYQISRKTGYKWLTRYRAGEALSDRSRRPHHSPSCLPAAVIDRIIGIREQHPYWGARKIRAVLARQALEPLPAKSAIHTLLKKQGYIKPEKVTNTPWQRFEHTAPNHLWQMDFKGHFAYEQGRCHPLTILDDHSRYAIALKACGDERGETVKPLLIETFRRYGLPARNNVDNGNPWGSLFDSARYTRLSVWLIRNGVQVSYSRPGHPQTNGKDERFHRTLKQEVLTARYFSDLAHIQATFDDWRLIYNLQRPHEALGMQVPADRYYPSYRPYAEVLPPVEYAPDYVLRTVDGRGRIHLDNRQIFVGMPFVRELIGIRPAAQEDVLAIYYYHQKLGEIDLQVSAKKTITNLYSGKVTPLG